MTITVTYLCDRCKATTDNPEKIWLVEIKTTQVQPRYVYSASATTTVRAAHWCDKCCDEMHVKLPAIAVKDQPPPPSLEEVMREVMRDEISAAESNR